MFNKKEWKATDSAKEVLGASNQNRLENGIALSHERINVLESVVTGNKAVSNSELNSGAISAISDIDLLADNAKTADIRDAVNAIIKACKG